jgi:hypothetical protein
MKRTKKPGTEAGNPSKPPKTEDQSPDDFPGLVDMTGKDGVTGFQIIGARPTSPSRPRPLNSPRQPRTTDTDGAVTETILELGAELGSLTLVGRRTGADWQFCLALVDQSGLLLDDEEEVRRTSDWVDGWSAALRELDELGWVCLTPIVVHEEFRARILEAVRERLGKEPDSERELARWEMRVRQATADPRG